MIKKIHLTNFIKNYKKYLNNYDINKIFKNVQTLKTNGIKTPNKINAKTLRTLYNNVLEKIREYERKQYFEKNGKFIARSYARSNWYDIREAYQCPSEAKCRINYFLRQHMENSNGFGYKILSANCQMFTAAYFYKEKNKLFFKYETPCNTHILPGKKMQKLIRGAA